MRIDYHKNITEAKELELLVIPAKPELVEMIGYRGLRCIVPVTYDLKGIEKKLLDVIEKDFHAIHFKTTRSASNRLWVSEPDQLALKIEAEYTRNKSVLMLDDNEMVQKGKTLMRVKKILSGFKEVEFPVYYEIPKPVKISGNINYTALEGVEPSPILNILNSHGYSATAIPTPEEVAEAVKKIKTVRGNNANPSGDNTLAEMTNTFLATGIWS